jgi:hypothetical protein
MATQPGVSLQLVYERLNKLRAEVQALESSAEALAEDLAAIDASWITSGEVARARLPAAIAYEDEANSFSAQQQWLAANIARFWRSDNTQRSDIGHDNTGAYVLTNNGSDVWEWRPNGVRQVRLGASGEVYERARTTALGEPVTHAHSAGDYTSNAGTWTVDVGDIGSYRYTRFGRFMHVELEISGTDTNAAGGTLYVQLPAGITINVTTRNVSIITVGGVPATGQIFARAGTTKLEIYRDFTGTSWGTAAGVGVFGQIIFETTT